MSNITKYKKNIQKIRKETHGKNCDYIFSRLFHMVDDLEPHEYEENLNNFLVFESSKLLTASGTQEEFYQRIESLSFMAKLITLNKDDI